MRHVFIPLTFLTALCVVAPQPAHATGIPVFDAANMTQSTISALESESLGQTLGQTMAEMIRKNLNIAPTLQIRPGYRFNVMVTKDMVFQGVYGRKGELQ